MFLVVCLAVVLVLEEEVLVRAVSGESDRCVSEARKCGVETVPAREGSLISPCLTDGSLSVLLGSSGFKTGISWRRCVD